LVLNTTGNQNVAVGDSALFDNTTASGNTAIGNKSLTNNTNGTRNTALGYQSVSAITTGDRNTGVGYQVLLLSTGSNNTALGSGAGATITTGTGNTLIGREADVSTGTLSNATALGNTATVTSSNAVVLGNASVTKWGFGVTPAAANILEFVNTTARLTTGGVWTNASDINLKENITPVDGVSVLAKLKELPITQWNYKKEDASILHIGPMAQDFNRLFHLGNDDKTISTIDPAGIALAAIKEQQKTIETLQHQVEELQKIVTQLTKGKN
jgi:hypothetical protein